MRCKLLAIMLVAFVAQAKAASLTNFVFSQTTISNMFYTNRVVMTNYANTLSNNNYIALSSNLSYSISNLQWLTFSNNSFTTNFAVIIPDNNTNWMRITNGVITGITNAEP